MLNNISYWEKSTFFNFDIIVIGSGIVGLNAAIHLKNVSPNLKIAILEGGFLPSGASTKNAGFACFGSISELIEQEKNTTTDGLKYIIEKRWKGLLKLRHLLGDKTIDYQPLGGHELFKNDEKDLASLCVSKIEHFNYLIKDIIGKRAFYLDNDKIASFGFSGVRNMISNQYEAQIDTGKMMFSLMKYAQHLGISIFSNCEVDNIDQEENMKVVSSKQGKFKCRKLIVATNAFIKTLIPSIELSPGRGQVLITKPISGLKVKGTFHYDKGYYYFRNINNRVLLGGGRNIDFKAEETTQFGQTESVQLALENLLRTIILPNQNFEIDLRWSGIMAFGKQLEPFIAEVEENVFCATRCNGMGVAIGSQTGEDLANLVIKSGI
ncbi:FAD-binding oxidoreductase [Pedobacter chinensis]|uniref:FAD-binding oxidoreductase n=1 Tax=Pedobacter chinensis TaxID=2282421 RepID=A0A369PWB4_9SPHI|nr:FAD-binding oxidoreductase [Pedobacter chinensis]RDC56794.1 FAD-binding oxidoreductase [Pedobacter chinensis]